MAQLRDSSFLHCCGRLTFITVLLFVAFLCHRFLQPVTITAQIRFVVRHFWGPLMKSALQKPKTTFICCNLKWINVGCQEPMMCRARTGKHTSERLFWHSAYMINQRRDLKGSWSHTSLVKLLMFEFFLVAKRKVEQDPTKKTPWCWSLQLLHRQSAAWLCYPSY